MMPYSNPPIQARSSPTISTLGVGKLDSEQWVRWKSPVSYMAERRLLLFLLHRKAVKFVQTRLR